MAPARAPWQDPDRSRAPRRRHHSVRGRDYVASSPAEARRGGVVSGTGAGAVPDLDIRSNLILTETPVEPFRQWINELGLEGLDLSSMARSLPLASLRVSTSRAPSPSSLTCCCSTRCRGTPREPHQRVLEVIGRQRGGDRSVIFISHRMIEIAAVCDRAPCCAKARTSGSST